MKVKILLAPLLISMIIGLLVWLVYPAWTNGMDGVKEKRTEYATEISKLETMSKRNQAIDSLYSDLNANSVNKELVVKYLPEMMAEEEIIKNLNSLAGENSLIVTALSVSSPKIETAESSEVPMAAPGGADMVAGMPNQLNPEMITAIPPAKPTNFQVTFNVLGDYSQIKNLLDRIYRLRRFNEILEIEIKKPNIQNENATANNNLEANMVLNFSFFKVSNRAVNPQEPVFDNNRFNVKIISEIEKRSTDISAVTIENIGENNPFFP